MTGENKKLKKKLIICLIAVAICMVIGSVGSIIYIRNLPVDWDAGACGGGYAAFVFDKYNDELVQKYLDGSDEKSNITSIQAVKGTQTAEWEDQTIVLEFDITYTHSEKGEVTERLHFIGQRTWFDTYDWSGAITEG